MRRLPPPEEVLNYIELQRRCVTRSEVASAFDISYTSATRLLEYLSEGALVWKRIVPYRRVYRLYYCPFWMLKESIVKFVKEKGETNETELRIEMMTEPQIIKRAIDELLKERRIWRLIKEIIAGKVFEARIYPPVLYRSILALLVYARYPDKKTPDPICEVRVTGVSHVKKKWDIEKWYSVCLTALICLNPFSYWAEMLNTGALNIVVKAYERDEEIDPDELPLSVPVYERLNWAERYVCFYASRRYRKWRDEHPDWWVVREFPPVTANDYEYDEYDIKIREEDLLKPPEARSFWPEYGGFLRSKFDNEKGRQVKV